MKETEEECEGKKRRERRSEGCSPAFKRCSKLSAQYGPEGTPPLLTQTYHTRARAHTHTHTEGGISHLSPLFEQKTECKCVYTDMFAADWGGGWELNDGFEKCVGWGCLQFHAGNKKEKNTHTHKKKHFKLNPPTTTCDDSARLHLICMYVHV